MLFGIYVITVAPGAVATPIWDKANAVDVSQYASTPYAPALAKVKDYIFSSGRKGFPTEKLGRAVTHALTTSRPKTYFITSQRRIPFGTSWSIICPRYPFGETRGSRCEVERRFKMDRVSVLLAPARTAFLLL